MLRYDKLLKDLNARSEGAGDDEVCPKVILFAIGDFAAWEMTIKGLGPVDRRTLRITMGAPNRHDIPSSRSYRGYSDVRLDGNKILAGNGWVAENVGGLLTSHVDMHDPDEYGYGGGNVAEKLSATLYVLDVDVEIDGVGENAEETRGTYAPWVPEHVEQGEADWTDSLVPVKVTCRPEGLPTNVTVRIVADDLLRRTADGYTAVQSGAEFPAGSVGAERFYLCARAASATPRDKSVTAICRGVSDEAKYTAYACTSSPTSTSRATGRLTGRMRFGALTLMSAMRSGRCAVNQSPSRSRRFPAAHSLTSGRVSTVTVCIFRIWTISRRW